MRRLRLPLLLALLARASALPKAPRATLASYGGSRRVDAKQLARRVEHADEYLDAAERRAAALARFARRLKPLARVAEPLAGLVLLRYGASLRYALVTFQTFRVTGGPVVRDAARELRASYARTREAVRAAAPDVAAGVRAIERFEAKAPALQARVRAAQDEVTSLARDAERLAREQRSTVLAAKRAAAKAASGARLVLRDDGGLGRPLDAAPDKHGRFRLPALSGCELAADDGPTRDAWAAAIRSAIAAPG